MCSAACRKTASSAPSRRDGAAALPKRVVYAMPHRDCGFNFVDYLGREAKTDGVDSLTAQTYTVHSTINAQLQRDAESALQEGLAQYEMSSGRVQFRGPEANIADAVRKIGSSPAGMPAWQQALQAVRLPLYDVHWTPAVIVQKGDGKKDDGNIRVGLPDGRIMPLTGAVLCEPARPRPLRRGLCQRGREPAQRSARARGRRQRQSRQAEAETPSDGFERPGAIAGAADGAGRGAGAGEQDRPHPRHGRQLFLSAEPAQSHLADPAPARLGDQADHLSDRAAEGAATEHAGAERSAHAAADRQRDLWQHHPRTSALPTGRKITGRRATPTMHRAASSPCGAAWKTRSTS